MPNASDIEVYRFTVFGLPDQLAHCTSQFACKKCVLKLNSTVDASRIRSEVVISLHCHQI